MISDDLLKIYNKIKISLEKEKLPKAIFYFYKAYKIDKNLNHLIQIGDIFADCNKYDYALKFYKRIKTNHNLKILPYFLSMTCFPKIYKNNIEIKKVLLNFNFFLKEIEKLLKLESNISLLDRNHFTFITRRSIFSLPYTGINTIHYMERYQAVYKKILDFFLPDYQIENINKEIIIKKIGFVARDLDKKHTVIKLFKFIIDYFVEKNFQVCFFSYDKKKFYYQDKENVFFFYGNNFQQVQLEILNNNLDLLIYLDIGMCRENTILSNYKLGKIQIALWGHPVTSGSKKIDFFISSEHMEKNKCQNYYTEKVIKLPGLGINYSFEHLQDFNFKNNNRHLITCLQPPFKLSPNSINLFEQIIKKNNIKITFIGVDNKYTNQSLEKILLKKFGKNNFEILNPLSHFNYCKLINESKIILDTCDWSGGNSSLEAIYFDTPIITMEGFNLRSSHTTAILKVLDLENLSSNTKSNFLLNFKKLYNEVNFYEDCINKIKKNKNKLNTQISEKNLEELLLKISTK